jgi:hypothetical protein
MSAQATSATEAKAHLGRFNTASASLEEHGLSSTRLRQANGTGNDTEPPA